MHPEASKISHDTKLHERHVRTCRCADRVNLLQLLTAAFGTGLPSMRGPSLRFAFRCTSDHLFSWCPDD
jgi:hypothetical protein